MAIRASVVVENSICVGGNAESADAGLIEEIKNAIKSALPDGSGIEVEATACRGDFNGDNPCNIVNRLGVKGILIEQSKTARRDHHNVIAQAVVNVIKPLVNV